MTTIIEIQDLHKSYGSIKAVDGISFEVQEGEIFGMVGPNGAGKTTTIECVEGLRKPDRGKIRVLGFDPLHDKYRLRQRIGIQLQESSLHDRIKVWEILDVFASFYERAVDWNHLLTLLGLADKRDAQFSKLSGGQKQRLFTALALVNDPVLLFLDELTTGLDPQARRVMWDLVRDIRQQGKTIFLTTHFMEEAERLCDRVAIIDHGRIIALDTPENLVRSLGDENRFVFTVNGDFNAESLKLLGAVRRVERSGDEVVVYGRDERLVTEVIQWLESRSIPYRNPHLVRPTLEDVFLALTGREIR